MHRYYIVSAILFILPMIDFTVAAPAPVRVREKRRDLLDAVNIPEDPINMLGKRGDQFNELWLKFVNNEGHFANPEVSAARPSLPSGLLNQPLPNAEELAVSAPRPDHVPQSQESLVVPSQANAPPGPGLPSADHELKAAHALPNTGPSNPGPSNPGPSTVSDEDMGGVAPSPGTNPNH